MRSNILLLTTLLTFGAALPAYAHLPRLLPPEVCKKDPKYLQQTLPLTAALCRHHLDHAQDLLKTGGGALSADDKTSAWVVALGRLDESETLLLLGYPQIISPNDATSGQAPLLLVLAQRCETLMDPKDHDENGCKEIERQRLVLYTQLVSNPKVDVNLPIFSGYNVTPVPPLFIVVGNQDLSFQSWVMPLLARPDLKAGFISDDGGILQTYLSTRPFVKAEFDALVSQPSLDLNAVDRSGLTPFGAALISGQPFPDAALAALIARGVDFHDPLFASGVTPLHLAVAMRKLNVVAYLVQQPGVDVNARASCGGRVSETDGGSGCGYVLGGLRSAGGGISQFEDATPLSLAILFRNVKQNDTDAAAAQILALLSSLKEVDPNAVFQAGSEDYGPAQAAMAWVLEESYSFDYGDFGVFKQLIARPDLDLRSAGFLCALTPPLFAADSVAAIKLALARTDVDPNQICSKAPLSRTTRLMLAAQADGDPADFVSALLAAPGMSVNLRDSDGLTALGKALKAGNAKSAASIRAAGGTE